MKNERKGGITVDKSLLEQDPSKLEYESYVLPNEAGDHLKLDVSWNSALGVSNREKVRLTDMKTGTEYVIDRNQLMSILFIISDEADQMKFMKESLQTVSFQRRTVTTTLKQDHKKGDVLNILVDIPVEITSAQHRMAN